MNRVSDIVHRLMIVFDFPDIRGIHESGRIIFKPYGTFKSFQDKVAESRYFSSGISADRVKKLYAVFLFREFPAFKSRFQFFVDLIEKQGYDGING